MDRDIPSSVVLWCYHEQTADFTHLEFLDSAIGRGVREWNSPAGVSQDAFQCIMESNVHCPSCDRMFSVDGIFAHLGVDGCCTKPAHGQEGYKISGLPVSDGFTGI